MSDEDKAEFISQIILDNSQIDIQDYNSYRDYQLKFKQELVKIFDKRLSALQYKGESVEFVEWMEKYRPELYKNLKEEQT